MSDFDDEPGFLDIVLLGSYNGDVKDTAGAVDLLKRGSRDGQCVVQTVVGEVRLEHRVVSSRVNSLIQMTLILILNIHEELELPLFRF